jgi:hypothetical protein
LMRGSSLIPSQTINDTNRWGMSQFIGQYDGGRQSN